MAVETLDMLAAKQKGVAAIPRFPRDFPGWVC